ncbi:hypothetical protein X943_002785 [Babesia divergens]|uniref:Btz domain-containing protein n=1 Tax=Babesia divergens TaxID=32595 RepID=A0AAD9GDB7_BABDI|nr:hypothetical protein X943_002785 [Babesia divergens]
MKKREHKKHDQANTEHDADRTQTGQKSHGTQETRIEAKPDTSRDTKADVKSEGRTDQKLQGAPHGQKNENARDGNARQQPESVHYGRRNSFGSKTNYNRMDSYNSVTKGGSAAHENHQNKNYYKNEAHKKRADCEAEEDELVKTIMKLHRTRFKQFRITCENHYLEKEPDAGNAPTPPEEPNTPPQEQKAKKSPQGNSCIGSNVAAITNENPIVANNTANVASGQPRDIAKSTPTQQLTEQSAPECQHTLEPHTDEKTDHKDEQVDGVTKPKRQDVKTQAAERRKKNYNDRIPMDGDERGFGSYGKFRNRYGGNDRKREFKGEDKVQKSA